MKVGKPITPDCTPGYGDKKYPWHMERWAADDDPTREGIHYTVELSVRQTIRNLKTFIKDDLEHRISGRD